MCGAIEHDERADLPMLENVLLYRPLPARSVEPRLGAAASRRRPMTVH
jgi:hypothetical protein